MLVSIRIPFQTSVENRFSLLNYSRTHPLSFSIPLFSSTVQSGSEAKGTLALLGLNDIAGSIGLGCQQVPINVIGVAAAVQNQCKNTAVCCSGKYFEQKGWVLLYGGNALVESTRSSCHHSLCSPLLLVLFS